MPRPRPSGPVNPEAMKDRDPAGYQKYQQTDAYRKYQLQEQVILEELGAKPPVSGPQRDRMYQAALVQRRNKELAAREERGKLADALSKQRPDDTDSYMKALQRAAVDRELTRSQGRQGSFGGGGRVY